MEKEIQHEYEYILFSKMFFKNCNLIFAFFIVSFPLFTMLSDACGYRLINEWVLVFLVLYSILQLLNLINAFTSKNNRQILLDYLKKFPVIIALLIIFFIILSCIVNNTFSNSVFVYFGYFTLFICIFSVEKKYYKLLLNTLIIILTLSCVLSFIDPYGVYIWGFSPEEFPLSMQFINPNYAGSIIAIMIVVDINLFNLSKKIYHYVLYVIAFVVFAVYLFLNGSYSPIIAMIIAILFEIIYLWIKNKKCPWKIITLFLTIIPIIFLVDLYPNISEIRTCKYNFFLETCAVIDNILGTDILHIFGIEHIDGADGWNRGSLIWESIVACFSSVKSFFFGVGANSVTQFRPHNNYIGLFLEYGIIVLLLYVILIISFIYKLIKTKFESFNFGIVCGIIAYLFRSMFGSIIPIEYTYFLIVFAMSVNLSIKDKYF